MGINEKKKEWMNEEIVDKNKSKLIWKGLMMIYIYR